MGDFSYTVSKNDKGLSYIFLQQAKAKGLQGKNIDWNKVMTVFDKIQEQEKSQGQSLFSGGTNKTSAGWNNSYVIKAGDKIKLDESQMAEIYKAMGFEETTPKAATKPIESIDSKQPIDTISNDTINTPKDSMPLPNFDFVPTSSTTLKSPSDDLLPKDSSFSKSVLKPANAAEQGKGVVNSTNIKGAYEIIPSATEKGFAVKADFSMTGTPPEKKFFDDIKYDKDTKKYSVRNLTSSDESILMTQANEAARDLAVNNAIYKDISGKQAGGTALTDAEKKFMGTHSESLKTMGLQLDEKNEIIEIPKPATTEVPQSSSSEAPKKSPWYKFW